MTRDFRLDCVGHLSMDIANAPEFRGVTTPQVKSEVVGKPLDPFQARSQRSTRAMRHIVNLWPPISLSGPRQVLLLLEERPCRACPICFMPGMRRGRQHVCRNPVRKFGGCGRGRTGAVV